MKTALFIHSYAAATQMVARHWTYYKKSGWDIFGVGRENSRCVWPEAVPEKKIGVDAYIVGDNLPRRLVDTFRWFLEDGRFASYTDACVIEPDTIFLNPSPVISTSEAGAYAQLAGYESPPMRARKFYHCPWFLDRWMARRFVEKGDELLAKGDFECGHPDFFFGLVFQELSIPVSHLVGTFSRNSLDSAEDRTMVRDRIRRGEVWFVHGVKTPQQLAEILS